MTLLDHICDVIHPLPQDINKVYSRILNWNPNPEKAKRLLHIITAEKQPLSLGEAPVALAFSAGTHDTIDNIHDHIETDDKRSQKTIRDLCGLLVAVDSTVYFLHQTTKEFLLRNNCKNCGFSRW